MKKFHYSSFFIHYSNNGGQSLVEILVALGVGTIMIIGATGVIIPSLRANTQADKIQVSAALGKELIENTRVFSKGNWRNIFNLATSSANKYFLVPASPFVAATGTEGIIADGITSGLVGYWKLDESTGTIAYDFSGNANNGTSTNVASTSGKISQAFQFDGTSSKITLGSVTTGVNVSIGAWIKTTTAGQKPVFSNRGAGVYYGVTSEKFFIYDNSATPSPSMVSVRSVNDDAWHNVLWTSDGSISSMYIDGMLDSTSSQSRGSDSGTSYIGWDAANATEYFLGSIDDVRIYNRALSASEVKTLYSSNIYTRYFYVDNVGRDADGKILSSGGTNDPSTKKLTAVYGWPNGPTNSFATYLTRFRNNVFDQTDWSGGSGQEGPATTTNSRFSTSTGIHYTTTTGSIMIQLQ